MASRSPRARGLKRGVASPDASQVVALPAGAWIETNISKKANYRRWSRSPRARGLKHLVVGAVNHQVALPAGAWTEILALQTSEMHG